MPVTWPRGFQIADHIAHVVFRRETSTRMIGSSISERRFMTPS